MRMRDLARGLGRTSGPGVSESDIADLASVEGANFTGAAPVPVDGVTAVVLVTLPNTVSNGFVVKVAGDTAQYGEGQAFMVLEEGEDRDATDPSAAGSALFRIDSVGGWGGGAGHMTPGLRKPSGGNQALWIDPSENIVGLVIHNPSVAESATWNKDYVAVVDTRNANDKVFSISSTGNTLSTKEIVARNGVASRTQIGDFFGFPGIAFGAAADTYLARTNAGIVQVGNLLEFTEIADPAAQTNMARLYAKDNGAGKTQLCVRFATGAIQVLATQP